MSLNNQKKITTLEQALDNMTAVIDHVVGWMENDDYGDLLQDLLREAMHILRTTK